MNLIAPIEKVSRRWIDPHVGGQLTRIRLLNHNNPVDVLERWTPQQERIDDTKDRAVRADAQRQRENGDDCEAWIFRKRPYAKPDVPQHLFQAEKRTLFPLHFFCLLDPTERPSRSYSRFIGSHASTKEVLLDQNHVRFDLTG